MGQDQIDRALQRAREAKERVAALPEERWEASEDGSLVMVAGNDGPDVLETLPIPVGPPGAMRLDHSTRIPRARFVAAARSDVPDLASDIEALASDLQEAREEIERLKRLIPEAVDLARYLGCLPPEEALGAYGQSYRNRLAAMLQEAGVDPDAPRPVL